MEVDRVGVEMKFVNRIGQSLSADEIIGLQSSVLKLNHEYKQELYRYWGRVEGILANYYIVEAVSFRGATNFPHKLYFWSGEDFKFAELPAPRKEFEAEVKQMSSLFTGQHEKVLSRGAGGQGRSINLDGEDFVVRVKNFTELDRLSTIVHLIEYECQVVPLGAYRMIPTHELIRNPDFRGLSIQEAKQLKNYAHLRAPVNPNKQLLIECDKAIEKNDFLDSLEDDEIKGSWSLQSDESGCEVTIRSLLWPGYVGYHRCNSSVLGGVYMGTGVRNFDLPFLL